MAKKVKKEVNTTQTGRWTENGFQPTQPKVVKVVKKVDKRSDFDRLA